MNTNKTIEDKVVNRINKKIGKDVKNLYRASLLIDEYKERLNVLRVKLSCKDESSSSIKSALQCHEQTNQSIEFEIEKLDQYASKLTAKIEEWKLVLSGIQANLNQLKQFEQLVEYLKVVKDIQDISHTLSSIISGRDDTKIVNVYLSLYKDCGPEDSVIGRLHYAEAHFLKAFATRTAIYWYEVLKEKFELEFETLLKNIRWGVQGQELVKSNPSRDSISKMQLLAEYLLLIKSPAEESYNLQAITPSTFCQPVCVITRLLLAQFRQRFEYHFYGVRQTNRLDKPEWFFTQILNWSKDTQLFVGKTFQPSVVRAGILDLNIRLEFIRGLVQLAMEKLANDIEEISRDENLFAHLLDETLAFEAELRETLSYPGSFPSAISVITQPTYLLKWISLEEQFCAEKMDLILQGEHPWTFIDPDSSGDLKIPKCADQFIRLLEAIKDRYSYLIQPGHQLQFLNLQLELIDNFRRRLVQLHSSGLCQSIHVLNAINYVTSVLREWGENVHYLHLHAVLIGPNANEINSVFDHCVDELEHWQKQLIHNLALKAVNEIKAKSMAYRHDIWATMINQSSNEPLILSTSAAEMFQIMVTTLHNLEQGLSSNLFNLTLRIIARQIDDFLLENLIMNTKFSSAGAAQFKYDMTRNLFALFGQYTRHPDLLFKKVNDATKLLNASQGTSLLLYETLTGDYTKEEKLKSIEELGIIHCPIKTCIEILERRTDISNF